MAPCCPFTVHDPKGATWPTLGNPVVDPFVLIQYCFNELYCSNVVDHGLSKSFLNRPI